MLTTTQILAFLFTSIVLTATPGPDNLMVLSFGISRGRRSGMAFGIGCALGCFSHTFFAVIGVTALVAASPLAFTIFKLSGGVYLIWLGIQALRNAGSTHQSLMTANGDSMQRLFIKGLVANTINPKVALFFLSFLPQFVNPANDDVQLQIGLLGILFTLQTVFLFGLLGYFSGSVGAWLNKLPKARLFLDRVAGTIFIALGIRMFASR